MAPSPELGQPKAPDKMSTASGGSSNTTTTSSTNNSGNRKNSADTSPLMYDPGNCSMTTSSSSNSTSNTNTTATTSTVSSSIEKTSKNLRLWKENELKELLDEAYSYKNPKDRINKSETFLRLLAKVEGEKDNSPAIQGSRYQRASSSHKHGGSLQDLAEVAKNIDSDYSCGTRNRRNHNSRTKKYSSVSSRQREGGSLPSNVNVSNCNLSVYEPPFLNEVSKKRNKTERTCSGTSCASGTSGTSSTLSTCTFGHESVTSSEIKDDTHLVEEKHTVIEIGDSIYPDETQHLLAHDSLAQGQNYPLHGDEGLGLINVKNIGRPTMSAAIRANIEISYNSEPKNWVDDPVTFHTLERGKNVDSSCVPFDDTSKSCKSLLGEKTDVAKPSTPTFQISKVITQFDENGNSLNSPPNSSQTQGKVKKKKSQFRSDRNTTVLNIKNVEGYRGEESVEELVKFIENTDTKKNDKNLNVNKKKDKKKEKDIKKDMHKAKKSNSLEELRSCAKLDEDDKSEPVVPLRSKGKKSIPMNAAESKENIKQSNSKRGERRSWGTEELTYLGENNAIEEREKIKEKEKSRKSKEFEKQEKLDKCENKKKKDEQSLSVMSMESVQSETAEFHVVTKKKKMKKRQTLEEVRPAKMNTLSGKEGSSSHRKYQSSSSFANDRDVYLSPFNVHESRRKSTSSVPPSEKSDSSDLDSVHSLPIESTSNRHHLSSNNSQMQQQSYADIARTVNPNKQHNITSPPIEKMDKWPIVSGNAGNITLMNMDLSSFGNNNSGANKLQALSMKSKSLTKDFPDLITDRTNNNHDGASSCSSTSSTSTIVKQISYSQSLGDEAIKPTVKSPPVAANATKLTDVIKLNDFTKQTLQKSKSVESDSYCNIDQYPALEKTVKRHATQNLIHDLKSVQVQGATSPPSSSSSSSSGKQQRSPSLLTSIPINQQVPTPSPISFGSSTTANVTTAINSIASAQSDNKSKIVVNNLDMNTNIAATSSSSNISNLNSSSISINNGKKSKTNAKAIESSSPLVEVNNIKNKQQLPTEVIGTMSVCSGGGAVPHNSTNSYNCKKSKSDGLQMPAGGNLTFGRKTKKDRTHGSGSSSSSSNPSASITCTGDQSSASKNSTRPAVIILNDINDSAMSISNDFTFGDFNEEELRLFDNNHQLDDSGNFNATGQDVGSSISMTSDTVHDDIHLSPHSDLGYSSSNNRSMFSESIDCNSATNQSRIEQTSSVPSIINDFNISINETQAATIFLNENTLVSRQNCLVPQNCQQSNVTSLGTTKTNVLSNNNINTSNSNININLSNSKARDNIDLINYDTNVTANSCNSADNINVNNNSIQMSIPTTSSSLPSETITNANTLGNFNTTPHMLEGTNCSNINIALVGSNTGAVHKSSSSNWDNQQQKFSKKEINIRYVAPPITHDVNSINYEKIVDFVGLAWEDIVHGINGETEFYDGQ